MSAGFIDLIHEGAVVFDGAMGTMLYSKGVYINACFDALNIDNAALVEEVHSAYLRSGADVIETNTFGANRFKLAAHGLVDKLRDINLAGVRIARRAVQKNALVAGAIGPLGIRIEPWGRTSKKDAQEAFREQAEAICEGGVDLICLETFYDLEEIHQAILAVRRVSDCPLVAQMTIDDDGNSLAGTTPEVFTKWLDEYGADVIGINCSVGPQVMLDSIRKMAQVTEKRLAAQPNAGKPRNVQGRNIYLCSPEYMAEYAKRFIRHGVRVIGGCCGTTPTHIRAIKSAVRAISPDRKQKKIVILPVADDGVEPVPRRKKSELARTVSEGRFAVTVELTPPMGCDPAKTLKKAAKLKAQGVNCINLPDGPRASARMGAQFLSHLIQDQLGMETILHYCCRDRNLLGMQSDLLGTSALGQKNLLIITGDPPKLGDYPDATAVFDVDAVGLTRLTARLNRGLDVGGKKIGKPTGFFIGVGVNPGAINLEEEIARFRLKVEAGAEFAITQPVFDVSLLEAFLEKTAGFRIPVFAGIWPLVSYRNAEFMNNEVPGAHVPPSIMDEMKKTRSSEEGLRRGIAIAKECLRAVRGKVEGVQISAPLGRVSIALEIVKDLKDL
jgi:homocysteine S-methyltransferase